MNNKFILRINRGLAFFTILSQLFFIFGPAIQYASAEEITVDPQMELQTEVLSQEPIDPVGEPAPVVEEQVTPAEEPVVSTEEPTVPVEEPTVPIEEPTAPVMMQAAPVNSPELTTNKADYFIGETATIFGRFFQALQNVILKIFGSGPDGNDYTETAQNVTADNQGSFTSTYALDNIFRPLYTITANSTDGTQLAKTTFTDTVNLGYNLDQCQNGKFTNVTSFVTNLNTACGVGPDQDWANGDINGQNSAYREGDSIPYRLIITGISDGMHTVTLEHEFTKAGIFAIDRLTGPSLTQQQNDCGSGSQSAFSDCDTIATSSSDIPGEVALPNATQPSLPNDGNLFTFIGANHLTPGTLNDIPNSREMTAGYPSTQTFSFGSFGANVTQTGLSTGDSNRLFSFNFTMGNCITTGGGKGCSVVFSWSGHISSAADWGDGKGASSISGAPFHMYIDGVDGSGGAQQRSVQLGAIILPSTITIHKATSPTGGTGFGFTTTGGLTPSTFSLDGGGTKTFNPLPGPYTISENDPSPAYSLTDLTCTADGQGTSVSENLGTRTATMTIGPSGGATIDCTYTNTLQQGNLVIVKNTVGGDGKFDYSVTGPTPLTPSITTSAGTGSSGPTPVDAGTNYAITETVPSGWAFTSATCDKTYTAGTNGVTGVTVAAGQTTTCTFSNSKLPTLTVNKVLVPSTDAGKFNLQIDSSTVGTGANVGDGGTTGAQIESIGAHTVGETAGTDTNLSDYITVIGGDCASNGSITLAAGDNKVCTITNTKKATIIVKKTMNGGTATFSYTGTPSGDISVSGNTIQASVAPGQYVSTETPLAGWDLNSVACDNANSTGNLSNHNVTFNVTAGQTVTCTFINTKRGSITIVKNTTGGDDTFNYTSNFGVSSLTTSGGTASQTVDNLIPGDPYHISESALAGWDASGASCDHGTISAITVLAGQTTTCTFSNTKRATIIVKKVMVGGTDTFSYTGTPSGDISVNDGTIQSTVVPGQYVSTETPLANWDLTSVACSDANSVGSVSSHNATFNAEAGETITCTFTNTKRGHVIVNKVTYPSGDAQSFDFTAGGAGYSNFSLTDAAAPNDQDLALGTYSVSEAAVTGWTKVSATCDDGSPVSAIDLSAGETITCTFTNVRNPKITIATTKTNEVDSPHTFTVTIGQQGSSGFVPVADGTKPTVTFTPSNPGTITDNCATTGTVGGSCTVVINSAVAGVFTAHAAVSVTIGGQLFNLATDGTGENSNDAVKTYVDAGINISPQEATNKVGDHHTITAFVTKNDGSGISNAVGVTVNFSITSGSATFVGASSCLTDGTGHCSVQIESDTPGSNIIDATVTFSVGGVSLTRATNGDYGPGGSDSAVKNYVDAKINITPGSFTNEVGDDHDFIVTVSQDTGAGFVPVQGAIVNAIASPAPDGGLDVTDCNLGTDVNGQCTLTINSSVAGKFTIIARSQIDVEGVIFKLQTNGSDQSSGPAIKTYVDAKISLTPLTATNNINVAHTITATVMEDPGTGMVAAAGEFVAFSLLNNSANAAFVLGIDTCQTNGSGVCTVQISAATPGSVDIHATVNVHVGGLILTRATDNTHGSSGNANKVYVAGKIIVVKQTLPDDSSQSFTFNPSYGSSFNLTGGQSNDSGFLAPGNYSVSETVPAGWDQTSATCDDGSSVSAISLQAGETVTCTFTNTQRGHLIVQKTTIPAGDSQVFNISASGSGTITGGGAGTVTDANDKNYEVTPGTYSVAETVPSDWAKTDDACQNVAVGAGETKTCLLTNTKKAKITLEKICDPDDAENFFSFSLKKGDGTPNPLAPVQCGTKNLVIVPSTADSANFVNWTITETATNGWILKNITCTGGGDTTVNGNSVTVGLDAGENVHCTFTNEAPPTGRMTGGGSFFPTKGSDLPKGNVRITHGFTLHCNTLVSPNRLEVNWAGTGKKNAAENNFHLTSLANVLCINDPDISEGSPVAGFDTYEGYGTGLFNGIPGYTAHWVFTDAGEPGKKDEVWMVIKAPGGEEVLRIGGAWDSATPLIGQSALQALVTGVKNTSTGAGISQGNQQAHK